MLIVACLGLVSCPGPVSKPAEVPDKPAPASSTAPESSTPPVEKRAASASGVPAPVISGDMPVAIPPHDTSLSPTDSRPFFDVFSWQSFIALNWPVVQGKPGVANQPDNPQVFQSAPNGTPVVWMSYKTVDDLFGTGNDRPLPWATGPNAATTIPEVKAGMPMLSRATKAKSPTDLKDINEAFSFPLVDQNNNYARFDVRYNQPFYDFVRGQDSVQTSWLYLLANLTAQEPVSMPASAAPSTVGAFMMKASWRELTPGDVQGNRYYTLKAMVYNMATQKYEPKVMGLVGLHIAQKLSGFPQWIWSTFEQVDNVQRGPGATATTPISFNNGTDNPKTAGGWANRAEPYPPTKPVTPTQVTRYNPIPNTPAGSSTVDLNAAYQAALKGTVWQFYELVITQWPSDPTTFKQITDGGIYPQDAGGAFPANGCTNTTMETYFQMASDATGSGGNSCMSCHYRAGQSDFSWGLNRRAH